MGLPILVSIHIHYYRVFFYASSGFLVLSEHGYSAYGTMILTIMRRCDVLQLLTNLQTGLCRAYVFLL